MKTRGNAIKRVENVTSTTSVMRKPGELSDISDCLRRSARSDSAQSLSAADLGWSEKVSHQRARHCCFVGSITAFNSVAVDMAVARGYARMGWGVGAPPGLEFLEILLTLWRLLHSLCITMRYMPFRPFPALLRGVISDLLTRRWQNAGLNSLLFSRDIVI